MSVFGLLNRVLLPGLVLAAGGFGLSLVYRLGVPVAVCLAGGVLVAAGWELLRRLPMVDVVELVPVSSGGLEQRASFGDLHTLELRLSAADGDQDRFDQRVRPYLAGLVVEVLRQRHGVDWHSERAAAEEVLPAALAQLMTAADGAVPASRRQVADWVEEIEKLYRS